MEEIWKDIPNYEGYYQASSLGRIKSLSRIVLRKGKYPFMSKEKVLKPALIPLGYYQIVLHKNGIKKGKSIHSLVAESFLNHKPNGHKLVVNHKNFNREDNRVENLEIITNRENTNKKHKKSSSKYVGVNWCKRLNKWVAQIWVNGKKKNLGCFENEYDAHLAYQKALNEL